MPWRNVLLAFSALLGAAVGSFLNVCIYRLPRKGLSVSKPRRSFCPSCGMPISWRDNVPLASWILLGARCRQCHAPISSRYFVVEALTAVLFFVIAHRCLFVGDVSMGACAATMLLSAGLVVASFVDLDLQVIPDEITLGGMLLVPVAALLVPDLQGPRPDATVAGILGRTGDILLGRLATGLSGWLRSGPGLVIVVVAASGCMLAVGLALQRVYWTRRYGDEPAGWQGRLLWGALAGAVGGMVALNVLRPETLASPRVYSFWAALWGMLAGASLVFLVGFVGSRVFRKPAMGLGDVKLMGLLGAFTGWIGVVEGFFLACFVGAIVGIPVLVRQRRRARHQPVLHPVRSVPGPGLHGDHPVALHRRPPLPVVPGAVPGVKSEAVLRDHRQEPVAIGVKCR